MNIKSTSINNIIKLDVSVVIYLCTSAFIAVNI
jgi:hypothetical protein